MVQAKRLELPRLAALDPKSSASANSAMPAGDPAGTRTRDPKIKSLVLYQLSYWIILFSFIKCGVKGGIRTHDL